MKKKFLEVLECFEFWFIMVLIVWVLFGLILCGTSEAEIGQGMVLSGIIVWCLYYVLIAIAMVISRWRR